MYQGTAIGCLATGWSVPVEKLGNTHVIGLRGHI